VCPVTVEWRCPCPSPTPLFSHFAQSFGRIASLLDESQAALVFLFPHRRCLAPANDNTPGLNVSPANRPATDFPASMTHLIGATGGSVLERGISCLIAGPGRSSLEPESPGVPRALIFADCFAHCSYNVLHNYMYPESTVHL
jgi:hypothetical protein